MYRSEVESLPNAMPTRMVPSAVIGLASRMEPSSRKLTESSKGETSTVTCRPVNAGGAVVLDVDPQSEHRNINQTTLQPFDSGIGSRSGTTRFGLPEAVLVGAP